MNKKIKRYWLLLLLSILMIIFWLYVPMQSKNISSFWLTAAFITVFLFFVFNFIKLKNEKKQYSAYGLIRRLEKYMGSNLKNKLCLLFLVQVARRSLNEWFASFMGFSFSILFLSRGLNQKSGFIVLLPLFIYVSIVLFTLIVIIALIINIQIKRKNKPLRILGKRKGEQS